MFFFWIVGHIIRSFWNVKKFRKIVNWDETLCFDLEHNLKESVNYYYVNNGSSVYCSFLDASKAFDRLVHSGLYLKLMERNVPKMLLDIVVTWYNGLYCRLKWDDCLSEWFPVSAGVRQGGILSPDFYCIYVGNLIVKLKSLNAGCYMLGMFAAALLYSTSLLELHNWGAAISPHWVDQIV